MKLLLVDDDRELVDLLGFALKRAGFRIVAAHDAPSALNAFAAEQPDLAVLDVNIGPWDGFELLRELRRLSDLPIIMLTGRDREEDKVRGLELGADDYVTKPFSHRELTARIRAHLRRRGREGVASVPTPNELRVGSITLNPAQHAAENDGRPLALTVTEFRLLHYLMTNAGTVVPTRAILKQVWGYDDPGGTDVVRAAMHRLRRKLGEEPGRAGLLQTVPGVGVLLKT